MVLQAYKDVPGYSGLLAAPWGRYGFAGVQRRPGAFTLWPGCFLQNISGLIGRPGRLKKKKKHTPLTRTQRQFGQRLDLVQEISSWRGLGLQMVRALNTMWAFDHGATMPGDWT